MGSGIVVEEGDVCRNKDLSLVKIDTLPVDAGMYRSWRNAFLTKVSSIDRTGRNVILQWLSVAFDGGVPKAQLNNSDPLFRLDAHLAAQLMEPKHLKSEIGLHFQAYAESCQQALYAPKGRVLLRMLAERFYLDLQRGSNLTQQPLLELPLESFTYTALRAFIDKTELILNGIPASHQPSQATKFQWLWSRLRKCRALQRHVDRIRDSREGSHVRSFDWLFSKLRDAVSEMREDQNEQAIRQSLGVLDRKSVKTMPKARTKEKAKAILKAKPKGIP